jgi:hypothetical protein
MKKIFLLVLLIQATIVVLVAQPERGEGKGEKYFAQKIAYLTTVMDLSPEESAIFWPLYNEFEKKRKAYSEEMRGHKEETFDDFSSLTEDEAKNSIKNYQEHLLKMNDLTIEYQNKYLEVISAKKVLLLFKAEKDFRKELLKKLGKKRNGDNRK